MNQSIKNLYQEIQYELSSVISRQRKIQMMAYALSYCPVLIIVFIGLTEQDTRLVLLNPTGSILTISICIMIFIVISIVGGKEYKVLQKMQNLISRTQEILTLNQEIQEILQITQSIYDNLRDNHIFTQYNELDYQNIKNDTEHNPLLRDISRKLNIGDKIINLYIILLRDIQADIETIWEKQKNVLESGKGELENIEKELGYDNIATIQKTRLDKQIEQFEELQRVLVKV